MTVTARLVFTSPDIHEAISQTVMAFEAGLDRGRGNQTTFGNIGELALCFGVAHPAMPSSKKGRASYSRDSDTFFSEAYLSYRAWVGEVWTYRVAAVAQAAKTAVSAVHKTRLSSEERASLITFIETIADEVARAPPEQLYPLKPISVVEDELGRWQSTSFQGSTDAVPLAVGQAVKILHPEEIETYFTVQTSHDGSPPRIAKFYKREAGRLHYWEVWSDEVNVLSHVGVYGERGTVSTHPVRGLQAQRQVVDALADEAAANGFKPIPEERLTGLLVKKHVGSPTEADLRRRHELEDFLNETTGWLGLGHCDGGSIGAGSMEAFCLVVDFDVAADAIRRELATSQFSDFTVCRDG